MSEATSTAPRAPSLDCVLAWGLALAVPTLLILAIGLPWWQQRAELNAQIEKNRDQLSRYQSLVATLPALRAELEREQANEDFKAFYYDAQTPALAGARLQSEVQDMIRAAGARPISTQVLPASTDEQPPKVLIRTQLQGTTDELLDVLYRIEAARPFLFVDQMSVRSTSPRARPQPRRAGRVINRAYDRSVGQLTVRLDVFGYSLGGAP
jgi:general secretion pathway protein M